MQDNRLTRRTSFLQLIHRGSQAGHSRELKLFLFLFCLLPHPALPFPPPLYFDLNANLFLQFPFITRCVLLLSDHV